MLQMAFEAGHAKKLAGSSLSKPATQALWLGFLS
jgi:hypothetical protein